MSFLSLCIKPSITKREDEKKKFQPNSTPTCTYFILFGLPTPSSSKQAALSPETGSWRSVKGVLWIFRNHGITLQRWRIKCVFSKSPHWAIPRPHPQTTPSPSWAGPFHARHWLKSWLGQNGNFPGKLLRQITNLKNKKKKKM